MLILVQYEISKTILIQNSKIVLKLDSKSKFKLKNFYLVHLVKAEILSFLLLKIQLRKTTHQRERLWGSVLHLYLVRFQSCVKYKISSHFLQKSNFNLCPEFTAD